MAKKKGTLASPFVPVEEQPYPIPENWCWTRLGNITEIIGGGTPSSKVKEYYEGGSIPWISPADLSGYNDIFISRGAKNITKLGLEKSSARLMPAGTVCLSSRAPIGYVVIATNELCTNQGFKSFLPATYYLPQYLYWYLKGNKELLESYASGTTFLELSGSKAALIEFPLAPLPEQQRIVDRIESLFTKLDEAKEKAQAVVDGFELRKSAILHKAFTGELAGISGGSTIPLESIVETIRIGPFGSALHKEDYITGGIPVVNPKHIIDQQIVPDKKVTITEEKASELMAYRLRTGDIVVGRRGEMGRSAPVTEKEDGWLCGTGSLIIRLQDGYSGAFYSQIIASHSSVQYLEENCVGSTMNNLNEKIIKSLPVPNYTREQQKSIVDALTYLLRKERQAKEAAEAVLTQIDIMKKAILARAFRGELGTNDPAEEWAGELVKKVLREEG